MMWCSVQVECNSISYQIIGSPQYENCEGDEISKNNNKGKADEYIKKIKKKN